MAVRCPTSDDLYAIKEEDEEDEVDGGHECRAARSRAEIRAAHARGEDIRTARAQEDLRAARTRGYDIRAARKQARVRGEETNKLLHASEHLLGAVRQHALLAEELRKREEEKAKNNSTSWWNWGKKQKRVGRPKAETDVEGSAEEKEDEDPTQPLLGVHQDVDTQTYEPRTTVSRPEHEVLLRRLSDEGTNPEDFARDAVRSNVNVDSLLEDMFSRAEHIQHQTDVLFQKALPEEARRTRRQRKIGIIIVISVIVTVAVLVLVVVLLTRQ